MQFHTRNDNQILENTKVELIYLIFQSNISGGRLQRVQVSRWQTRQHLLDPSDQLLAYPVLLDDHIPVLFGALPHTARAVYDHSQEPDIDRFQSGDEQTRGRVQFQSQETGRHDVGHCHSELLHMSDAL